MFKKHQVLVLANWFLVGLPEQQCWMWCSPVVSSNLSVSVILCHCIHACPIGISLVELWMKSGLPQACVPYITTCAPYTAKLLTPILTSKVRHKVQKEYYIVSYTRCLFTSKEKQRSASLFRVFEQSWRSQQGLAITMPIDFWINEQLPVRL